MYILRSCRLQRQNKNVINSNFCLVIFWPELSVYVGAWLLSLSTSQRIERVDFLTPLLASCRWLVGYVCYVVDTLRVVEAAASPVAKGEWRLLQSHFVYCAGWVCWSTLTFVCCARMLVRACVCSCVGGCSLPFGVNFGGCNWKVLLEI